MAIPAPEYERAEVVAPTLGIDPTQYRMILQGGDADTFLEFLRKLIKGGRLNQFYPNPNGLDNLYRLMAPAGNLGIDPEIRINPRCGLPSEPDIGRVLADKEAAPRFLARNDTAEVNSRT